MDEKFLIKTVPNCKNIFGSEIDRDPYLHYKALVNGCWAHNLKHSPWESKFVSSNPTTSIAYYVGD